MEFKLKKIQLFTIVLFASLSLEANYCIQVLSADSSERNSIVDEAKSNKYNKFDNVRVESRGRYLVLRVGDYARYKDAKSDIRALRRINREAYLRRCDFNEDKALYVKNASSPKDDYYEQELIPTQRRYVEKSVPVERRYIQKVEKKKKAPKTRYVKKEELTYSTSNKSLWGSCKKCFIPVYEDESEDDTAYVQEAQVVKVKPRYVKKHNEIEVRVQERTPEEDSFWIQEKEIPQKSYSKKYNRSANKFDIDEQFLP